MLGALPEARPVGTCLGNSGYPEAWCCNAAARGLLSSGRDRCACQLCCWGPLLSWGLQPIFGVQQGSGGDRETESCLVPSLENSLVFCLLYIEGKNRLEEEQALGSCLGKRE